MPRPRVTQAEFEQIECNRCGACCEKLWLPGPIRLVEFLDPRNVPDNATPEWQEENARFTRWLSQLVPTGQTRYDIDEDDEATHQYKCSRFVRTEDGSGFCNDYEDRPSACRGFPYGRPVHAKDFEDCSYNVLIVEEAPVRKGLRWLKSRLG